MMKRNNIDFVPARDRGQIFGLLLLYYGKDGIEKFLNDMLEEGIIHERKYVTFRRTFFLEDKPMSATGFTRKEEGNQTEPSKIPATREVKPRVKISNLIRRVPNKKRTFMWRFRRKLIKMLQC